MIRLSNSAPDPLVSRNPCIPNFYFEFSFCFDGIIFFFAINNAFLLSTMVYSKSLYSSTWFLRRFLRTNVVEQSSRMVTRMDSPRSLASKKDLGPSVESWGCVLLMLVAVKFYFTKLCLRAGNNYKLCLITR